MTKWELIQAHEDGKMPDWIFYQQIDKYGIEMPYQMRIDNQVNKFIQEIERRKHEQEQIELDKQLSEKIEDAVVKMIEKKLFS